MGIEQQEDKKRKMIELALAAGRKRLSPQTRFLHFFPEDPQAGRQDTIPVLENFCYVLALFRTKLIENIQEGKNLLERLLAFECNGNFPLFLHEYPVCRDLHFSAHLLPCLFYLKRDFSAALGEGFLLRLQQLIQRVLNHLQAIETLSKSAAAKRDAFLGRFSSDLWHPQSLSEWAAFWICCQMQGLDPQQAEIWDSHHFVYIGSCKERPQEKDQPAVTLLDLIMGEYFQKFSARSLVDHPSHLQASLIYPFASLVSQERAPYRVLVDKAHRQPFLLYWGDECCTHSLAVEAKGGEWEIHQEGDHFVFDYRFHSPMPSEEDNFEIAFYLSDQPVHEIFIEGKKASVFYLEEKVEIRSEKMLFSFSFIGQAEEDRWVGHLSKSCRSFQRQKEDLFAAFDWKIGLRTLQRKDLSSLRILLTVTPLL